MVSPRRYDSSNDGFLDADELHLAFRASGFEVDVADCKRLVRDADADGDGHIDFKEFRAIFESKTGRRSAD